MISSVALLKQNEVRGNYKLALLEFQFWFPCLLTVYKFLTSASSLPLINGGCSINLMRFVLAGIRNVKNIILCQVSSSYSINTITIFKAKILHLAFVYFPNL